MTSMDTPVSIRRREWAVDLARLAAFPDAFGGTFDEIFGVGGGGRAGAQTSTAVPICVTT
ncbi:hypothetical protein [Propionivibrio sp.]|uniref:hypothetical protein n=1 Tax=Propionivibrio sp. TaxID=2212460 RepID=UPI0025DDA220|nr:hypothetical protein [Propionivibrio sp.]